MISRRVSVIVAALLFGVAFAHQSPAGSTAAAIDAPALQREIVAELAGHTEIQPGLKLPNRFTPENREAARVYLESVLKRIGLEPKRQKYATGENVYAVLSCGKPNAETIIVGAHYDTVKVAPGANDNATGVAAVAGVALAMTQVKERSRDLMFVFFDEEERGLIGAKAFAQMLKDENRPINSVHTIDQMGWDSNNNRAIEIEMPYDGAMDLYEKIADAMKPAIIVYSTTDKDSDHQAFSVLGFKAVGVTEEYHHGDTTPFYHKAGDTFETVNFDYLTSTTKLLVEVMKTLVK